jgi:beta-lactam-binding protein with PASTA domain
MRFRPASRSSEAATVVDEEAPIVVEEERLPPPPPPEPPPRPLLWPWLLLLLVLVIGGLVAAWLLTRDNGHSGASTVNVPRLVGLEQQRAVSRLNRRGLIARIRTRASAASPATVVAQDPRAGADVTRRSVVTVIVAAAQVDRVPDVVGLHAAAAVRELRGKGFEVQTAQVPSRSPSGTVLGQTPQAGSSLASGSTVAIRVARGTVAVPDAVGQPRSAAIAAVRGAGLTPKAVQVPSSQPTGTVVSQSPPAGKRVAGGTTVRLNVSTGGGSAVPPPPPTGQPATVSVPDVTGEQQDAAQKQLNTAGVKPGVVYLASDEPQGTVLAQSPAGGSEQPRGKHVQLNVSLGPQPRTLKGVPDVRNLDAAAARSKLGAAGFRVQTLQRRVSDKGAAGKAVDEQPAGGRNAPRRSVVTIYVGVT